MTDILNNPVLIADIGATNARFALVSDCSVGFSHEQSYICADFERSEQAIEAYLQDKGIKQLSALCMAAAGPIKNRQVQFTNNHWRLSETHLNSHFGIDNARILNDFEAAAHCLPHLREQEIEAVGGNWQASVKKDACLGLIGPGSGLGVAGLVIRNGQRIPMITEGGHSSFAPVNQEQQAILEYLQRRFQRVSNERLLSGMGIVNIYEALCKINGVEACSLAPGEIGLRSTKNTDPYCAQAMSLYFEILGQVAGDLVLTLGAFSGLYIGGGITRLYAQQLSLSKFREGFCAKGRYQATLNKTPTWLITHQNAGLLGASVYAVDLLKGKI